MARLGTRARFARFMAAVALVIALPVVAAAQSICELRFIPPDGTKEICYDCDAPPDGQAAAECAARCSDPTFRRENPECAFRDGDRCASDEERINGVCVRRCADDERRVGTRCELLECPTGQRASRGECVPLRRMAQAPQCVTPDELRAAEALTTDVETLTERRLGNVVALAAVRFLPAKLPDGGMLSLPPGENSPNSQKFAASIQKLAKEQSVDCDPATMLSCVDPLTKLCQVQEDAARALYVTLFGLGTKIQTSPQYQSCLDAGDRRVIRIIELGKRAIDSRVRFNTSNEIFQAVSGATNLVTLDCAAPDINQCGIRLLPSEPIKPNRGFARRKFKQPIPGLSAIEK